MKKLLLALAVLSTFAGATQAQSSVAPYGVIDANIEYINHAQAVAAAGMAIPGDSGSRLAMQVSDLFPNHWGLRGAEDTGGDLKSLFMLESSFTVNTGTLQQGGRLLDRQAFVGLQGNWDKIIPSRQYTTIFDMMVNFSPTGHATQYEPVAGQLDPNPREDSMIKCTGAFSSVTVEGHWTLDERADNQIANSACGVDANYFGDPFGLGIAYGEVGVLTVAEVLGDPGNGCTKDKHATITASCTMGPVKLMGGYRYGETGTASFGATLALLPHRDDYYWAGVNRQVTPALGLALAYYYDKIKEVIIGGATVSPHNPQQWQFIADYDFSKRTGVYPSAMYARNASLNWDSTGYVTNSATGAQTSVGYLPAALQTCLTAPNSDDQVGVAIGLRHKL